MIHLEGMGVLGSMIAWALHQRDIQFTWHDIERPINAWAASTGAIFPTGDVDDQLGMKMWEQWIGGGEAAWAKLAMFRECVERASWWYSTKAPPHSAKGEVLCDLGALRCLSTGAIHFNAQLFVPRTRSYFAGRRISRPPPSTRVVVTHGFNERLHHYVWGWTRLIGLDCDPRMRGLLRPSIYCRKGRFVMAYAYAVPGSSWWYAGSNLIVQREPRALEMEKKYQTWLNAFTQLTDGLVKVRSAGDFLAGWRPAHAPDDTALVTQRADGTVVVRPCWHNGVRLSPLVVRDVLAALEFK